MAASLMRAKHPGSTDEKVKSSFGDVDADSQFTGRIEQAFRWDGNLVRRSS